MIKRQLNRRWTLTGGDAPRTHIVPRAVVVALLAPDLNSLVGHVEGVDEFPVCQEQSHEVVLLGVGDVQDEAEGRLGLQGQGEVAPGRTETHA